MKTAKIESSDSSESLTEFELPDGWNLLTVGEISSAIQYGYTESAIQKIDGPRFLRITDIQDGRVNWDTVPSCEISKDDYQKFELKNGDIVFARTGATTGKSFLIQSCPNAVFASYLIRIRPNERVVPKFLHLFFQTPAYWQMISENVTGIAQPNCNASKLKNLPIPLPPFAEQQRIVAHVEALLTHVNAARDRLSRVPLLMKKFRQTVLAAACSGGLTEGWREENPEIASAIIWMEKTGIKSINLQPDLMIPEYLPNLPESWDYSNVKEIAQFIGSGITPKGGRDVYVPEGIPFIRSQNVYPDGLRLDDIVFVTEKMHKEMKRTHVFPNDVLLNITGASIGRCTCVPEKFIEANVNQHVCIIRVVSEFLPKYLSIFLNSPHGQKQVFDSQGGVTRQGLNYNQLRAIILPLPPLAEQHEIVRRVGMLFERADAFDQEISAASRRCERLAQAVLGKAFSGRL